MSRITFRAYLLDQEKVKERVIRIEDPAKGSHVYLVNSVCKEREVIFDWEGIKGHKEVESKGLRFRTVE